MAAYEAGCEENAGSYLQKELDKEWRTFHKTLGDIPHSFQLEDQEQLGRGTCSRLLTAVQGDIDDGLPTPLEVARSRNLLGYLHFQLDKPEKALQHIERALTENGETRNLVSLANKAVILWQTGNRDKAKSQVKALKELKKDSDFSYLTVKAKAELAFSYTRLGGHLCSKAVSLFTAVIEKARKPEIWIWKFGFALTERRMVHMNNVSFLSGVSEDQKLMGVLHTLQEVITNCQSTNLTAKCYAEIAQLLQWKRGSKSERNFEEEAKLTSVRACEKALALDPDDCSVLWKCGKIFRYAKRLDESVKHLEKSVMLRPTTTAYHHLGLTFKALAKRAVWSKRFDWNGRRRENSRGGKSVFKGVGESRGGQGGNRRGRSGRGKMGRGFVSFHSEGGMRMESDSRQVASSGCVRDKNNTRWNANQQGGWRRNYDRNSATDASGRGQQQGHVSDGPEDYSDNYSQLCLPTTQRTEGFRKNHSAQESDQRETEVEENTKRYGTYEHSQNVYKDTERFTLNRKGQDEKMTDDSIAAVSSELVMLDFSRLSLSAGSTYTETITGSVENQISLTRSCNLQTTDKPSVVLSQQACDKTSSATPQREIQSFRQVIKSPSSEDIQFHRNDEFVQQTMDAFEKAVEISKVENTPAVYDLALMHKALGEFDKALHLLNAIQLSKHRSLRPFDKINAYEQAGLILKDMSAIACDPERKKRLNEEGESKLNMALLLCSRLCNRLPQLSYLIQDIWIAFPTLFEAAETSDRDSKDKMYEKARLFQMIKKNQQSMAVLQEISNIPKEQNNPKRLKMCIENYVELEHYDQALTFIETLKCTAQCSTMDHFDDEHYVQKVYMKAAKAALLKATSSDALNKANSYFSAVFADIFRGNADETSSSEDADSIEEAGGDDSWDVMFLHETSAATKADALANIFEEACGLRITSMDKDCLPGRLRLESVLWFMKKSKQVVILAGGSSLSCELRLLLEKAAKQSTTVGLLVDGDHVPTALNSIVVDQRQKRHMICPEELLSESNEGPKDDRLYPQGKVQAVCDVFSFLVNIPCT